MKLNKLCSTLIATTFATQLTANVIDNNNTDKSVKPNIIYILADDMGYGDVTCLNPEGKFKTPNIDKLASNGITFTDAHSTSAICTPSRYGILNGRYSWRSSLKSGLTWSHTSCIIEKDRKTIAQFLKENGYDTAMVGKWHLGWDWTYQSVNKQLIDYTKPISGGPQYYGFDYSYAMLASLDIPPYVYVENNKVTGVPDRVFQIRRGKLYQRSGDMGCDFTSEGTFDRFKEKALQYIDDKKDSKKPYFLYYALSAPHVPILPTENYVGKSKLNEYGDFCLMVDNLVGEIVEKVKANGDLDNTIIVFTSDNGCDPNDGVKEAINLGHSSSYKFRGAKFEAYEGGHRIPLFIQYPNLIKKGQISNQLVGLQDFYATVAELIGVKYADNVAEDSVSNLPLWLGEDKIVRDTLIGHSAAGKFTFRKGDWKLILSSDGGRKNGTKNKSLSEFQLYNLKDDISETKNLINEYPEIVIELQQELKKQIMNGRTTVGEKQINTSPQTWPQLYVLDLKY